jgi:Tol biopolymer transport system component
MRSWAWLAAVGASGVTGCLALLLLQCGVTGATDAGDDVPLPNRVDGVDSGAATDAKSFDAANDTAADARVASCDPSKPFGTPVRVVDFDAKAMRSTPRLSADELTIYFTSNGADAGADLSMAVRSSTSSPFGGETVLAQSTPSNDNDPMASADQRSLWFHSRRNGTADIFEATRAGASGPFGVAATIPGVDQPTTNENHAYFRSAGSELWFISDRPGGAGGFDIYVAKRSGTAFGSPARVAELSSAADDWQPQPSEDGLTVLFASARDGGAGKMDLWIAHRSSVTVPFGTPSALTELNSPSVDQAGWLSADGCRIWFSSGRDTSDAQQQIFFAKRPL